MWKEAVWPNMNIPAHAWRDWQRSQLTIRPAGLRAEIPPQGLLNAKQQWLQIDATVGPVNINQLPYLSSITYNPCSIYDIDHSRRWKCHLRQGYMSVRVHVLSCVQPIPCPRYPIYVKGKGKAIPLQAWTGPEGSRRLRLPHFKTIGTWRC